MISIDLSAYNFRLYRTAIFILCLAGLSSCGTHRRAAQNEKISAREVQQQMEQANDYWQRRNPEPGKAFWDVAAYHTGNIATWEITGKKEYLEYSEKWAEHNLWMGARSNDKTAWKYKYGETDEYVLFGDWQVCFQTYADLYQVKKDEKRIARAREVMEYEMGTPNNDYWWWADGLYMVMPVMVKMYGITGNQQYLEKLHTYFMYADSVMYDKEEGLYYRDGKYIYPKHKSVNGKKDFWARGDGWVLAALAKTLKDLPKNNAHRQLYIDRFTNLAAAVKNSQQPAGHWTRSLLDTAHAPGYETSGTAFFTYGLLWGINNGYLDAATYAPVAIKAWQYLTKVALQPDGKIGYVQPIGERAIPGQVVDRNSTTGFGVGAFLLAGSEMHRYLSK